MHVRVCVCCVVCLYVCVPCVVVWVYVGVVYGVIHTYVCEQEWSEWLPVYERVCRWNAWDPAVQLHKIHASGGTVPRVLISQGTDDQFLHDGQLRPEALPQCDVIVRLHGSNLAYPAVYCAREKRVLDYGGLVQCTSRTQTIE